MCHVRKHNILISIIEIRNNLLSNDKAVKHMSLHLIKQ